MKLKDLVSLISLMTFVVLYVLAEEDPISIKESPEGLNITLLRPIKLRRIDGNEGNSQLITEVLRDKRALGLILSGLAQVFGYTVTPVQVASLPNPSPAPSALAGVPVPPPSPPPLLIPIPKPSASLPSPIAPTPAPTKQQETIRFTGVVNFGNTSDILGHLQRYERIFHGNSTTAVPRPAMVSPTSAPLLDPRSAFQTRPPLLSPFLVKIPLPIAPDLPLPLLATPEITLPDYTPYSLRTSSLGGSEKGTEYRNNQNTENYTIEDKEIHDEEEVRKPDDHRGSLEDEPHWKQKHANRLVELKYRQEEQAMKLRGGNRDREKDGRSREEEIRARHRDQLKEIIDRDREHSARLKEQEEKRNQANVEESNENLNESSGEVEEPEPDKYKRPSSTVNNSEESQETEDSGPGVNQSYKSGNPTVKYEYTEGEGEFPGQIDGYTDIQYDPHLPISESYVKSQPDRVRDSYGEILDDDEKSTDDRLSSYFTMFKNPQTGVYETENIRDRDEDADDMAKKNPAPNESEEEVDDGPERLRQEFILPIPITRYEEYEIGKVSSDEENENQAIQRENSEETSDEDENQAPSNVQKFLKYNSNCEEPENQVSERNKLTKNITRSLFKKSTLLTNGEDANKNQNEDKPKDNEPHQEFRVPKYYPYARSTQYIYQPVENDRYGVRISPQKKLNGPENMKKPVANRNIAEDLKPKIGLPQRLMLKNLHEVEAKRVQAWPAPFDYVFDSSERSNIVRSKISGSNQDARRNNGQNFDKAGENSHTAVPQNDNPLLRVSMVNPNVTHKFKQDANLGQQHNYQNYLELLDRYKYALDNPASVDKEQDRIEVNSQVLNHPEQPVTSVWPTRPYEETNNARSYQNQNKNVAPSTQESTSFTPIFHNRMRTDSQIYIKYPEWRNDDVQSINRQDVANERTHSVEENNGGNGNPRHTIVRNPIPITVPTHDLRGRVRQIHERDEEEERNAEKLGNNVTNLKITQPRELSTDESLRFMRVVRFL